MSKPMAVSRLIAKAKSLSKSGDLKGAEALYQEVLDRFPGNKVARAGVAACRSGNASGKALSEQAVLQLFHAKEFAKAREMGEALLVKASKSLLLLNVMGAVYSKLGDLDKAIDCFRRAIAIKPDDPNAHANLGKTLDDFGKRDEAEVAFRKAVSLEPNHFAAKNNLANVLNARGETEEAKALWQQAILAGPEDATTHRNFAMNKKFVADDPHIAQMTGLAERLAPDSDALMHISFALAKAFGDIGAHDRAFGYLETASGIHKQMSGYKIDQDRAIFAQIKKIFAGGPLPEADVSHEGPLPIFVVGMPRSGTTLVEQILASHRDVHGVGEPPYLFQPTAEILNASANGKQPGLDETNYLAGQYMGKLRDLGISEPMICDKTPLNFRFLGFIFAALPKARVIHLNRDPMAVGWSNFQRFFPGPGQNFSYDLGDVGAYISLYLDLMAFWRETFPGRFIDLSYESLTENQEAETRRILEFCGLDWDPACLDFHETKRVVQSASTGQVRQPMYKGSSQAWRAYEAHLAPLKLAILS